MTSTLAALPRTPDELADAIWTAGSGEGDPHGIADNQENLRALIARYQDENVNRDTFERQITEQVEAQFARLIRDGGVPDLTDKLIRPHLGGSKAPAPAWRPPRYDAVYNPEAVGAGIDNMFEGKRAWADFLRTVSPNNKSAKALEAQGKIQEFQNAYTSDIPDQGAFLIATEAMRADLMSRALEGAIVRPRAVVVPMSSLTAQWPVIDETTHSGSVFGGITAEWLDEGQEPADSTATWGMLELRARQLSLYTEIPNTLLADAPMLNAWINRYYPEALRWAEDLAFWKGNGVGKPLGVLNAPCAIEVAKETGQAADSVLWKNLLKVYSRVVPSALNRFLWVANLDVLPELGTLKEQVGTGGSLIWIGEGQGDEAPPVRILGRPVHFTEKSPTLGDAGDITAWDPMSYVIGDREMMMVDSSTHFKFRSGKTAVKVVERVDGRTTVLSALTPETGSNTLSPVVKIAARA